MTSMKRWAEHFIELLNGTTANSNVTPNQDDSTLDTNRRDDEFLPTAEETASAIQCLKNQRSLEYDGIPPELLKQGGPSLVRVLHALIERVWVDETMPEDWNSGVIIPLHKKGDTLDCHNYRGITLLNTEVLSNLIYYLTKLQPYVENTIGQYQCGFRRNRSTMDQVFALRTILEKMTEFGIPTHHLFNRF
ncbi:unnamed protein product [Pieris macdunnoughi]|uniref:Reverse transcriptase domain-containing protein n=1 Tax=Pieris macdunnoughi TaxID=345717 RepID=A0A821XR02_9NEOP|nr:unnamed protein product [Pieris macdunnoughi]